MIGLFYVNVLKAHPMCPWKTIKPLVYASGGRRLSTTIWGLHDVKRTHEVQIVSRQTRR
jgi:hypothetical protein